MEQNLQRNQQVTGARGPWKRRVWINALLGFTLTLSHGPFAQQASPASSQQVIFHIAAAPLAEALSALAQQSGLTIVMYSELSLGIRSAPLDGPYIPREALDRLLENTGLSYEYTDANTVMILRRLPGTQRSVDGAHR